MKNPFPYSIKYILICYGIDLLALLSTVYVATSFGFKIGYGLKT